MIETTPEGFKILVGRDGLRQFMVDSDRLDESIRYVREHDIRMVGINSYLGYKRPDIDFLSEMADFLEGVVVPEKRKDISVLNTLHCLRYLGFADNGTTQIDLANFPNLSTLACEYSRRLLSLEKCERLEHLSLTNYKPKERNLEALPGLRSLTGLALFSVNIESFAGIGRFPALRSLNVFKAPKLVDIRDLFEVRNTLGTIEFDRCKSIDSYPSLGKLENLEKLIISDCSPIPSLDFAKELRSLKFLSFVGTNIVDGDLRPVAEIDYVGFDDRKHYSHTFVQISKYRGAAPA